MASRPQQFLPLGIALGAGIGAFVGVVKDDMVFYLGMGIALGVVVGVIVDQRSMVKREVKKGEQERKKDNIIPKY